MPLHPAQQAATPGRRRSVLTALVRGLFRRCPNCGVGSYRSSYLTVAAVCPHCGEPLGHIRADDGPAYFTVLIVGHIVVPGVLTVEQKWHPPLLPHMTGALLATVLLVWLLLPSVKGAVVGVMWALRLRGDEHHGDG